MGGVQLSEVLASFKGKDDGLSALLESLRAQMVGDAEAAAQLDAALKQAGISLGGVAPAASGAASALDSAAASGAAAAASLDSLAAASSADAIAIADLQADVYNLGVANAALTAEVARLTEAQAANAAATQTNTVATSENTAAVERNATAHTSLSAGLVSAGGSLGVVGAAALAAGAGLAYATDQSMKLDTTLNQLQNNTSLVDAQMGAVRDTITNMASDSGRSFQELADGYMRVSNFGFSAADSSQILEVAMHSAVATAANLNDVAIVLAGNLSLAGKGAESAAGYMDVLHIAAQRGNTTLEEFVAGSGKAFAIAGSFKQPVDETAAAISALTSNMLSSAQAATQVFNIYNKIAEPTAAARKEIEQLAAKVGPELGERLKNAFTPAGLEANHLSGTIQILDAVYKKLNLSQADAVGTTERLIAAQRGGSGLAELQTVAHQKFTDTLNAEAQAMAGNLTPTQDAWNRTQETSAQKMNEWIETMKVGATRVGDFTQNLIFGADGFAAWDKSIRDWMSTWDPAYADYKKANDEVLASQGKLAGGTVDNNRQISESTKATREDVNTSLAAIILGYDDTGTAAGKSLTVIQGVQTQSQSDWANYARNVAQHNTDMSDASANAAQGIAAALNSSAGDLATYESLTQQMADNNSIAYQMVQKDVADMRASLALDAARVQAAENTLATVTATDMGSAGDSWERMAIRAQAASNRIVTAAQNAATAAANLAAASGAQVGSPSGYAAYASASYGQFGSTTAAGSQQAQGTIATADAARAADAGAAATADAQAKASAAIATNSGKVADQARAHLDAAKAVVAHDEATLKQAQRMNDANAILAAQNKLTQDNIAVTSAQTAATMASAQATIDRNNAAAGKKGASAAKKADAAADSSRIADNYIVLMRATQVVTDAQKTLNDTTEHYRDTLTDLDRVMKGQATLQHKGDLDKLAAAIADTTALMDGEKRGIDNAKTALADYTAQSQEDLHTMDEEIRRDEMDLRKLEAASKVALAPLVAAAEEAKNKLAALRHETEVGDQQFERSAHDLNNAYAALDDAETAAMKDRDANIASMSTALEAEKIAVAALAQSYEDKLVPLKHQLALLDAQQAAADNGKTLRSEEQAVQNLTAQLANARQGSAEWLAIQQQLGDAQGQLGRDNQRFTLDGRIKALEEEKNQKVGAAQADLRAHEQALKLAQDERKEAAKTYEDQKKATKEKLEDLNREKTEYDYQQKQKEIAAQEDQTRADAALKAMQDKRTAMEQTKKDEIQGLKDVRDAKAHDDGEEERRQGKLISDAEKTYNSLKTNLDNQTAAVQALIDKEKIQRDADVENATAVVKAWQDRANALREAFGVVEKLDTAHDKGAKLTADQAKALDDAHKAIDAIVPQLPRLHDGYTDVKNKMNDAGKAISDKVTDLWAEHKEGGIPYIYGTSQNKLDLMMTNKLKWTKDNVWGAAFDQLDTAITGKLAEIAKTQLTNAAGVGANIDAGIAQGITAHQGEMTDALNAALDKTLADGQAHIQAHSPSEVSAQRIGMPMGEGVVVGIDRLQAAAGAAMGRLAGAALAGGSAAVYSAERLYALPAGSGSGVVNHITLTPTVVLPHGGIISGQGDPRQPGFWRDMARAIGVDLQSYGISIGTVK